MSWKLMENAITLKDKLSLIKFIVTSDRFTNGRVVKLLEDSWNNWLESKYSLFVSSGSTANYLLLAAIKEKFNIQEKAKVLVPACTWMTNVAPILQQNLHPIFCDVSLEDFSYDIESLKKIADNHPDIKIIFVTHLIGYTSRSRDEKVLENLFPEALILDDVCESHGCSSIYNKKKIGSDSLGATFSTYFGHHLTTIEGGFISTNDKDLYDLMKMKRSHGLARESENFIKYSELYKDIDKNFLFITDGYNFRNTDLNAVLGLNQLKNLDNNIKIRNKNYKQFCSIINTYTSLFYALKIPSTISSYCFPFICKTPEIRENLTQLFKQNDIEYRPIISGNLTRHPFINKYNLNLDQNEFTTANLIHDNGLYIGNSQFVDFEKINYLIKLIDEL